MGKGEGEGKKEGKGKGRGRKGKGNLPPLKFRSGYDTASISFSEEYVRILTYSPLIPVKFRQCNKIETIDSMQYRHCSVVNSYRKRRNLNVDAKRRPVASRWSSK